MGKCWKSTTTASLVQNRTSNDAFVFFSFSSRAWQEAKQNSHRFISQRLRRETKGR